MLTLALVARGLDVKACCEATPLTGALRPGCCKVGVDPGISALRTSGPPLDHGAQRGGLLLAPGRANSSVGGGESRASGAEARGGDPIEASTCARAAGGGSTGLIQIIGGHGYNERANSLAVMVLGEPDRRGPRKA